METLKLKLEETKKTEKEVEVKLPCFRKTDFQFFKIKENGKCINIQNWTSGSGDVIIQYRLPEAAFMEGTKDCTEEEFEEAFHQAIMNYKIL